MLERKAGDLTFEDGGGALSQGMRRTASRSQKKSKEMNPPWRLQEEHNPVKKYLDFAPGDPF